MAANPKRKRKKDINSFFAIQPGSRGWSMSDPDAAPTAYYRQRKTVLVLLHTNRSGEETEMVYRIPVDMTGVPKENERGYKTKLRQAIKAQIPELKTNQEVRDAAIAYMPVDTFRYMPERFRHMEDSGWKGYTDPSDFIRDRFPKVTPATSDAAVLAIRDALTQGSWKDYWSAPVSNYRKFSMFRHNPTSNLATPKQVLVRSTSESELIELIPVAEDALLALGATDVKVQPIQNIDAGEYTVLFIVEGLGEGKRWSSTQKTQFRRLVSAFLPSQIREPNFQPDSDRTRRSKRKSRAMRKVFRRPNPLN